MGRIYQGVIKTTEDNLFLEIIYKVLGEDHIIDPNLFYIIVDTKEKNYVQFLLHDMKDVVLIYHALTNGDYLVSNRMAIELKIGTDYSNSVFGKMEHNIWDQMFRLRQSVTYPNLIIQDIYLVWKRYEHSHDKPKLEGALESLTFKFPVHQTIRDKETADLIYKMAKREQKPNGSGGFSRSVPKNANLREMHEYLIQGLPRIGSKLSKKVFDKEDENGNIVFKTPMDFFRAIQSCKLEYANKGKTNEHPKGKKGGYLNIGGVGAKKIIIWKTVLLGK